MLTELTVVSIRGMSVPRLAVNVHSDKWAIRLAYGDCSSDGRALVCGTSRRGFKSRQSPADGTVFTVPCGKRPLCLRCYTCVRPGIAVVGTKPYGEAWVSSLSDAARGGAVGSSLGS